MVVAGDARERDAAIALARGWHGPVVWVEDEGGCDPYAWPPGALGEAGALVGDRDLDHIVPAFTRPGGNACACHGWAYPADAPP